MSRTAELSLHLHPKQGVALNTPATEVLYGGAAGGGKSHLMRAALTMWSAAIPGLQCYLFRRIEGDLVKNHLEGPKGFRSILAPWTAAKLASIVEGEIRFWNGSKIYLCHCKDEKDRFKYQGAEMHVLAVDELTHFTEVIYRFLRSRNRMAGIELPPRFAGMFPRILCGANPGGIGHGWVRSAFIDPKPALEIWQTDDKEGGMLRQYIPALMSDNPSLAVDDPGYRGRLRGLGSKALVEAMELGNWDIVDGAYFDCWNAAKHVIRPFEIPRHWQRFRSFDWGGAKPFSTGWWAVADGEAVRTLDGEERFFPRGALIRYREWYGSNGEPNVGLKMRNEDIAAGILEREKGDLATGGKMFGVADPSIFKQEGGPAIAEAMALKGCYFSRADNNRQAGWSQLRSRLVGFDDKPMLYVFDTCRDFIRTVPVLQHDLHKPEDVDSDGEDHVADDTRYACMSRPIVKEKPPATKPRDRYAVKREEGSNAWMAV